MPNNGQQQTSTRIHPLCEVADGVSLGKGVTIDRYACIAQGTVIGAETAIAQCVDVGADTVIGKRASLDAGVVIAPGSSIGDEVYLGVYVALVADMNGRALAPQAPGAPITIGRGARIGGKSTIGPGVTVGEYAVVAPEAVITEDIPPYAVVTGNPARVIGSRCHCGASPAPAPATCPACAGIRNVAAALDALV